MIISASVLMFVIAKFFCKAKITTCLIASLLGLLSVVPIVILQYIFADVFQVEQKIESANFFSIFMFLFHWLKKML